MSLVQFFETMEGRLFNLDCSLRHNPHVRLQEEADALCEELQQLEPMQARRLAELNEARQTLIHQEIEAAMLASSVEASVFAKDSTAAWQQALELEQLRKSLQDERDRVERLEDAANEQATVIRSLEYRLSLLQQKLYA
jgi:folate-binding Fe-S cluster repair protein YgfZ